MTSKILLTIVIIAVIVGGILLGLRLLTPEDTWLCQNGEWVKHGVPNEPMPTTPCPGANINQNENRNVNQNVNVEPVNKPVPTSPTTEKNDVIVTKPAANSEITSPLEITGQATGGWYFEAVLPIKLLDASGKEIAQTQAQAQGEWTTPELVPFKATLKFSVDKDQAGTLIIMNDNPSGLAQNQKEFKVPVILKAEQMIIKVFFGNEQKNPNAMDCSLVYPVERQIAKTTSTARAALTELLNGPTDPEKSQGYFTSINTGVKIQKLTIVTGLAKVDFDETLEKAVGGSCRVANIRSQITQTLKQFSSVKEVIISINGRTEDILQP
ncbi:MAG: GerMN domain-containing protein [Candidatus Parcubacteria bacterium]|nr:GerMN domain-containing protein [Candidatus Parcubacteria bacterium]